MSVPQQDQLVYEGRLFSVTRRRGVDETGRAYEKEFVRHPGAVLVVPRLPGDRVVMIRNLREAVDETLWELPAGKLESGEAPQATAARELIEETGYRAGHLEKVTEFYTSPGFADELMHVYLATDLAPDRQQLEPGERITVQIVAVSEALNMIRDGEIRDGKTIAGLLMCFAPTCEASP